MKKSSPKKTSSKLPPWALKKPISPTRAHFVDLPTIFSGPDSAQLWKAIARLGNSDMTADDVHEAFFQLASSMQALEARLVSEFKRRS